MVEGVSLLFFFTDLAKGELSICSWAVVSLSPLFHHQHTAILTTSLMGVTLYVACILAYFPINAHEVICTYAIFVIFEGHICCWHVFYNSIVNKCCSLLIFDGYIQ